MCVWEGRRGRERGIEGETHLRNTGLNKTQPSSLLKDLTDPLIAECSLSVSSGDTVYKPVGIWDSLFCYFVFHLEQVFFGTHFGKCHLKW